MTKTQQIKTFARMHGLTVKACRSSGTVSICGKIVWDGQKHVGWAECFENYDEMYDRLTELNRSGSRPWLRD